MKTCPSINIGMWLHMNCVVLWSTKIKHKSRLMKMEITNSLMSNSLEVLIHRITIQITSTAWRLLLCSSEDVGSFYKTCANHLKGHWKLCIRSVDKYCCYADQVMAITLLRDFLYLTHAIFRIPRLKGSVMSCNGDIRIMAPWTTSLFKSCPIQRYRNIMLTLYNKSKCFYMNIYIVNTKNLNPDVTRQNIIKHVLIQYTSYIKLFGVNFMVWWSWLAGTKVCEYNNKWSLPPNGIGQQHSGNGKGYFLINIKSSHEMEEQSL